eukprot:1150508-Pelagomonas_calceolata.AAC.2
MKCNKYSQRKKEKKEKTDPQVTCYLIHKGTVELNYKGHMQEGEFPAIKATLCLAEGPAYSDVVHLSGTKTQTYIADQTYSKLASPGGGGSRLF